MADPKGASRFLPDVFQAELDELRRRRRNAGNDRPLPEEASSPTTELDLVGLACSGGGIRSASFCLGVVQHLIENAQFRRVDYVSTVSGGGYLGSLVSALMHRGVGGERLLVEPTEDREPIALNHVRNASNYLLPEGVLNRLRLPGILLVGISQIALMLLPPILAAVFVTEVFYEISHRWLPFALHLLPLFGLVPLLCATLMRPLVAFVQPRRDWATRDRADRRLGIYLLVAIGSLAAVPILFTLGHLVNQDFGTLTDSLRQAVRTDVGEGFGSLTLWAALVVTAGVAFAWRKVRRRFVITLVSLLGPAFTLTIYLAGCTFVINSPVVDASTMLPTSASSEAGRIPISEALSSSDEALVRAALREILRMKQIDPGPYIGADGDETPRLPAPFTSATLERHGPAPGGFSSILSTRLDEHLTVTFKPSADQVIIEDLAIFAWPPRAEWWFYAAGALLGLFSYFFLDVNRISLHPFYRDRLSRTFLIRPVGDAVESADELPLSQLGAPDSDAPYQLINCALNLQGSNDPQLRERKTTSFVFSKRFCGSRYTGYLPTEELERRDRHLDLGAAMAISAAAAAPNMGALPGRSLAFVMTLLNVRLDYWLPNPAIAERHGLWGTLTRGSPGLRYLFAEATGSPDARRPFVNCSDGGHIENLAVYELLRRRCRVIVAIDGEADPDYEFHGLVILQRNARIDFNIRIELDVSGIQPGADGLSRAHHAIGTIRYPDCEPGVFIYLKLSVTGDEPQYVHSYRKQFPAYPHQSTGDQFFDETQFEVYRALGEHVAAHAFADEAVPTGFADGRRD